MDIDREKIEIFVSGRKLKGLDVLSKSDPFAKLYLKAGQAQPVLLGQTEVLKNNENPNFTKTFQIDFIFEVKQILIVEMWDKDTLDKDDLIGRHEVDVGCIMGAKDCVYSSQLTKNNTPKEVILKAEKSVGSNMYIWWQWAGAKLLDVETFSKSDPFLKFYKLGQNGHDYVQIKETEFVKNNLDPIFQPFEIDAGRVCFNDFNRKFKVEVWDYEASGKHRFMGSMETTLNEVFQGNKSNFQLLNPKTNKNPGTLVIKQKVLKEKPSFVDYLQGGVQINMAVAIDFTGSNGVPTSPESLHFLRNDGYLNQYQTALQQICGILLNYDYDKKVPTFGFGAVTSFPNYQNTGKAEHCFPCNGNTSNSEVFGLDGILQAYYYALQHVKLSGPTFFAPIIQNAMEFAKQNVNTFVYTVLLILTDGEIHDMDKTLDLIVQASQLPLSFIIIGVGKEQFTNMQILDGDDGIKSHVTGKNIQVRDLTQFVKFEKYIGNPSMLSQELLAELPKQVVEYYQMKGIKPQKHMQVAMSQLNI